MSEVPEGMLRNGRSLDQEFDSDEKLFRRVRPEDFFRKAKGKRKLSLYTVELLDVSVVRSKHGGKPGYALYDDVNKVFYDTWGICSTRVDSVPSCLMDSGKQYSTMLHHTPHRENHHHSEIQLFDPYGGHISDAKYIPLDLKKRWQRKMRAVLVIEKEPDE